ncbi:hypothetical protein Scep_007398 [Stephania cephalantha]|uniref:Uncharacterized protein n=1 Tax=Stephania cephalantha TaxID=152367 RepID=A0AAP0K9S9_9MAGN
MDKKAATKHENTNTSPATQIQGRERDNRACLYGGGDYDFGLHQNRVCGSGRVFRLIIGLSSGSVTHDRAECICLVVGMARTETTSNERIPVPKRATVLARELKWVLIENERS